jgi:plastocyanin
MHGIIRVIGRPRATIAVAVALLLVVLAHWGAPTDTAAADVAVTIDNLAFAPATITVPVGTQVVWTNKQAGVPHTTTSDTGVWDSGILNTGATFSFTFKEAGTFAYHCNVHPTMHGTVVVTAGAAPATTGSPAAVTGTTGAPAAATATTAATATSAPAATATVAATSTAAATTAVTATPGATSTVAPAATGTGGVATTAPTTALPATGRPENSGWPPVGIVFALLAAAGALGAGLMMRRRAARR